MTGSTSGYPATSIEILTDAFVKGKFGNSWKTFSSNIYKHLRVARYIFRRLQLTKPFFSRARKSSNRLANFEPALKAPPVSGVFWFHHKFGYYRKSFCRGFDSKRICTEVSGTVCPPKKERFMPFDIYNPSYNCVKLQRQLSAIPFPEN